MFSSWSNALRSDFTAVSFSHQRRPTLIAGPYLFLSAASEPPQYRQTTVTRSGTDTLSQAQLSVNNLLHTETLARLYGNNHYTFSHPLPRATPSLFSDPLTHTHHRDILANRHGTLA